jgi:hypothetical protein
LAGFHKAAKQRGRIAALDPILLIGKLGPIKLHLLSGFGFIALPRYAVLALVDAAREQTVGANSGFRYIQELVNAETYLHAFLGVGQFFSCCSPFNYNLLLLYGQEHTKSVKDFLMSDTSKKQSVREYMLVAYVWEKKSYQEMYQ